MTSLSVSQAGRPLAHLNRMKLLANSYTANTAAGSSKYRDLRAEAKTAVEVEVKREKGTISSSSSNKKKGIGKEMISNSVERHRGDDTDNNNTINRITTGNCSNDNGNNDYKHNLTITNSASNGDKSNDNEKGRLAISLSEQLGVHPSLLPPPSTISITGTTTACYLNCLLASIITPPLFFLGWPDSDLLLLLLFCFFCLTDIIVTDIYVSSPCVAIKDQEGKRSNKVLLYLHSNFYYSLT